MARKDLVAGKFLKDVQKKIGLIMKNASYFEFAPVDAEKGVFMLSVSVAGKKFFKAQTKLSKDNKLIFDSYKVDETELNAFIEWIENHYVDLIAKAKGEKGTKKKNEGLAPRLSSLTDF